MRGDDRKNSFNMKMKFSFLLYTKAKLTVRSFKAVKLFSSLGQPIPQVRKISAGTVDRAEVPFFLCEVSW